MSKFVEKILNEVITYHWEGEMYFDDDDDLREQMQTYQRAGFPFKKFGNYTIFFEMEGKGTGEGQMVDMHICRDDLYMGTMETSVKKILNMVGLQIKSIEITDLHQGEGVGLAFYDYLINSYNFLVSDYRVSKNAQKIWRKLGAKYGMYALTRTKNGNDILVSVDKAPEVWWAFFISKNIEQFKSIMHE